MTKLTPMSRFKTEFSEIKFLLKDFFVFSVLNKKSEHTKWFRKDKWYLQPHTSKKVESLCVYLFSTGHINYPTFAVLFSDDYESIVFSYSSKKDKDSKPIYSQSYTIDESKVLLKQFIRNLSSLNIKSGTTLKDSLSIFEEVILQTFNISNKNK